jgi:predicted metalloprotease with PDZ domain
MQKTIYIFLLLFFILTNALFSNPKNPKGNLKLTEGIHYELSFDNPENHYCNVKITVNYINSSSRVTGDSLIFSMPVWTPGSYLVREFAKNVSEVSAESSSSKILPVEKINKNSWNVKTMGETSIVFSYRVYCNEASVRTSHVTADHGFISGAGVFMFVRGMEDRKCILRINLPSQWSKISTGLDREGNGLYSAPDYTVFIDSPIETGNQATFHFKVQNIEHEISITGRGNFQGDTLIKDFKKIVSEQVKFFNNEIPYKHFTFIIILTERGSGGLEHLNSFVAMTPRWVFSDEKDYRKFLGLVSHEFFHTWNVKRIRPEALGPFDYDRENYTKSLWVSEGITSFYDNLFLRRAGITNDKQYYEMLLNEINDVLPYTGYKYQSLEESSFDAWIKFYRRNENFYNSEISYYTKGALIALMLNLEIIKNTNGKRSLDDVMRSLWEDYKKDSTKGFAGERIKEIAEQVSGKGLNEFWNKYIEGTEELPLKDYLSYAGLELVNENKDNDASLGIALKEESGRAVITRVYEGGSAYNAGINVNDEVIAINDVRVSRDDIEKRLKDYQAGQSIKLLISRDGFVREVNLTLSSPLPKYKIEEKEKMTAEQNLILKKWLEG